MRISLTFSLFCLVPLVCLLFSFNKLHKKQSLNYAEKIFQSINAEYRRDKKYMKEIKIRNKKFSLHFIGSNSNNIANTNISSAGNKVPYTGWIDHKVVKLNGLVKTYNERRFYSGNTIIISSNKFFNKLKFIFTKEKLKKEDLIKLKETLIDYEKDKVFKYLIKKDQILNCILLSNKKIKLCAKNHHLKLRNFELPHIIFNHFNYFYFTIDKEDLEFTHEQF